MGRRETPKASSPLIEDIRFLLSKSRDEQWTEGKTLWELSTLCAFYDVGWPELGEPVMEFILDVAFDTNFLHYSAPKSRTDFFSIFRLMIEKWKSVIAHVFPRSSERDFVHLICKFFDNSFESFQLIEKGVDIFQTFVFWSFDYLHNEKVVATSSFLEWYFDEYLKRDETQRSVVITKFADTVRDFLERCRQKDNKHIEL